jgi:hypothetical protein
VDDVQSDAKANVVDDRFKSSTRLCPVAPSGRGALWVASGDNASRVAFEPQEQGTAELAARSLLRHGVEDQGVSVVGYDSPVTAAAAIGFPAGTGASACASAASDVWYFAEGSTENKFNQRIILYNPFPEEASVRITLYTDNRTRSPSLLSDLAVSANEHAVIDFIERTSPIGAVGAEIVASRGRVVAWRSMTVRAEGRPQGTEFSLGASTTATEWYFPAGQVDDETFTRIRVMNPTDDEASVGAALITPSGRIEPPSLEDLRIPPTSARPLDLERALSGEELPETFGVIVRSSTPVVAERTIGSTGALPGRSSEIGAPEPSDEWTLPPVGVGATEDTLTVMNPGTENTNVRVALVRMEGAPIEPAQLQLRVKKNQTVALGLGRWQGQAPFAAIVSSSQPVVVERSAQYAGDRSSAIGIPTGRLGN